MDMSCTLLPPPGLRGRGPGGDWGPLRAMGWACFECILCTLRRVLPPVYLMGLAVLVPPINAGCTSLWLCTCLRFGWLKVA